MSTKNDNTNPVRKPRRRKTSTKALRRSAQRAKDLFDREVYDFCVGSLSAMPEGAENWSEWGQRVHEYLDRAQGAEMAFQRTMGQIEAFEMNHRKRRG